MPPLVNAGVAGAYFLLITSDRKLVEGQEKNQERLPQTFLVWLIVGIVVGGAAVYGYLHVSGPKTYNDCILESLPGTGSDGAAILIRRACREEVPE